MISLRILFVVLAFFRGQFQQKKTGVGGRQQRLAIHYSLFTIPRRLTAAKEKATVNGLLRRAPP
jgi:hypothetical protein